VSKSFALNEVPLWYVAGSVIPYIPLRSLATSIGNAGRQYTFLGFKIVPGASEGSVSVYEDDGASTAYLTQDAYAWTTATYAYNGSSLTVTISTSGSYPQLPAVRSYQLRLLNQGPLSSVMAGGQQVPYNRFGKIAAVGHPPSGSQYYWDFSLLPDGMGPVVDIINVPTNQPLTVVINFALGTPSLPSGIYGAITHALWAKANLDIERTTPGSNKLDPAYTSVLSSIGQALEYLSAQSPQAFAEQLSTVPALLANATAELQALKKSPRSSYSVAMLQNGMI